MTKQTRTAAVLVAIAVAVLVTGVVWNVRRDRGEHVHASDSQGSTYYCPMHPSVTSNKPGNCPICGMKLVRRTGSVQADAAAQIAGSAKLENAVALSPDQRVMANVKTMRLVPAASSDAFVTTGRVTFDERRVAQVTSYTSGRIERLYVNFTGDRVTRGSAVAEIYSPDLYAAQREYQVALANRRRTSLARELAESSRRRLLLLGMTSSQVDQLARGGRQKATTTIVAPVSGIVTRKLVVTQQSVSAGEPLFEVADLSTVWVEADVYENDLPRVAVGQRVEVSAPTLTGYELPGRVAFIQPVVGSESRATRVRIEMANRNFQLKPDMFVTVKIFSETGKLSLMVPSTAVIDRGSQQFVWIETSDGTFTPRAVKTGVRSGDQVEILSGLAGGESIVVEGAFLIESEAQLRSAPQG